MNYISHETDLEQRTLKALNLVDEAKLLNFAKMANVLIELFGLDDPFRKIGKREGQEVEMKFPALNGSLNFILVSDRSKFESRFGTSKNPTATILINVKREDAIKLVSSIITLRSNLFGILRIVPKLLRKEIKIKGSYFAAIKFCRCIMIGKNKMYKHDSLEVV